MAAVKALSEIGLAVCLVHPLTTGKNLVSSEELYR